MMTQSKRLGIVGGLFDPIHYGHLALGKHAKTQYKLDFVIFLPAFHPPHRKEITPYEKRCRMVELATDNEPNYILSKIEEEIEGPGYTVEVLKRFHEKYPESKLYFLIGSDNLCKMEDWYEPGKIFELAEVAMGYRPGEEVLAKGKFTDSVLRVDMPEIDISSTAIRNALANGENIEQMVPPAVAEYIRRENLYA